jgi:hypothetical protein
VLTLGSDSHAVVDPFEEMRAVELDERLATRSRGHWSADELLLAATADGHASLGFDAGRIAVGARADLVTLDTASVRTAGTGADAGTAVFAASGPDVTRVMRDGVDVTRDPAEVGAELDQVIRRLLELLPLRGPGSASTPPRTPPRASCTTPPSSWRAASWRGPVRLPRRLRPTRRTTSGGGPWSRASSTRTAT